MRFSFHFILVTLSIVFGLLSCTNDRTSHESITEALSAAGGSTSGGNGDYYGGKPEPGVYVRAMTSLPCVPTMDHLGEITVTEIDAKGIFVNPQDCSLSESEVKFEAVEHSAYQKQLIGLVDGIYTKKDETKKQIDEAWCRREGSTTRTGFDIRVRTDHKSKKYQAFITSAEMNENGKIVTKSYNPIDLEERRIDLFERVRYKAEDFEIDIRTRSFDEWVGTMKADFRYRKNGFRDDMIVNCRLGGELDVNASDRGYEVSRLFEPGQIFTQLVSKYAGF